MAQVPLSILKAIKERQEEDLFRTLPLYDKGIDFISNDYLGFSKLNLLHQTVLQSYAEYANIKGSGGSRLISGNSSFKQYTEHKIATFHKAEAALLFNSGYDANVGLLSSVPQKNDLVITDELIHASLIDGVRLSYAKHYKFKHNDVAHLKELLDRHTSAFEVVYVVVESVYSMDGDEAPLKQLVNLAKNYNNVFLIVDEAHAIGVFGDNGRGLCAELGLEDEFFARVYTYGKAMGCHGASVTGSKELIDYLVNFARSFIYTTALPDHSVANISAGYDLLTKSDKQQKLRELITEFTQQTKDLNGLIKSRSAIQCILINGNKKVSAAEKYLMDHGYLCKGVKSPTVKAGSERIRVCLHAYNTPDEVSGLIRCLKEIQ